MLDAGNPSATSFFKFQSFTTAVVEESRIRQFIADALTDNLEKGKDGKDFKKLVDDEFERNGLTKLKPYQIENIYTTNTSMAFAGGQMSAMVEAAEDFPYWKYSSTMDGSTRPSHAALHGKIFKNGDFTFFPPIGYKCRCTAILLTARQAGQYLKTDIPDTEQRQQIRQSVGNTEFIGNKNKSYMKWLAKQYQTADRSTMQAIDEALEMFKAEIEMFPQIEPKESLKTRKKTTKKIPKRTLQS